MMKACRIVILTSFLMAWVQGTQAQERLRMATTTSVQDSGLLPYLLPDFEKLCDCKVDVIAVGTGQALRLGSNGDVDLVLVHDPQSEKKFVEDGFGVGRLTFMVNDFVLLGPAEDPARVRGLKNASQAMALVQKAGSVFISRGDESGTHLKERALWQKAGIKPSGAWYLEAGQGMGAVLTMANEKQAYTLCDRATYLARVSQMKLQVLVEGDADLLNYYSAIRVNPTRFPNAKSSLARRLSDWLCSPEGQKLIGDYTRNGNKLFTPTCTPGK
jgi:tungstate transport system substrate-binding protein